MGYYSCDKARIERDYTKRMLIATVEDTEQVPATETREFAWTEMTEALLWIKQRLMSYGM